MAAQQGAMPYAQEYRAFDLCSAMCELHSDVAFDDMAF